jgi:hypothetical protein
MFFAARLDGANHHEITGEFSYGVIPVVRRLVQLDEWIQACAFGASRNDGGESRTEPSQ